MTLDEINRAKQAARERVWNLLERSGAVPPGVQGHIPDFVGADDLPETEHDFSVDLIITPTELIQCGPPRRPGGVLPEHLAEDQISAIPALGARTARTKNLG